MADQLRVPLYAEEQSAAPAVVCVTGVTGYVAGHVVQRLLACGHTVRGTCRAPEKEDTVAHLKALPGAAERLKLFKADLLTPGAFDEPVSGCDFVVHTASPFVVAVKTSEVQDKLLKPAVFGTSNVLDAVNKSPSVKRVVLTSSCASIYGSPNERGEGHVFTEEEWNTTSTDKVLTYSMSKKMAEEKAWEMAKAQSRWTLVTINPALVLGPPLTPRTADAESVMMMRRVLRGEMSTACPKMGIGMVDVRDVAAAHSVAMVHPDASGRYITCNGSHWASDMVKAVSQGRPDFKVGSPWMTPPKWLLWLVGPMAGMPRDVVTYTINMNPLFDNTRIRQQLGISFLPINDTWLEMADTVKAMKLA